MRWPPSYRLHVLQMLDPYFASPVLTAARRSSVLATNYCGTMRPRAMTLRIADASAMAENVAAAELALVLRRRDS